MEAHNKYVQFLFDVGLLDRLTCTTRGGKQFPTRKLLCEHGELLQVAITLRKQHNNIADEVINLVVSNRPSKHSSLHRHDLFYTDVSLLCDFFPALVQYQRKSVRVLKLPQERVSLLVSASTLMDSLLRDAILYRHQKAGLYNSSELFTIGVMQYYVPWTSDGDIRSTVTEQLDLLLDSGLIEAQDSQNSGPLWNSIISLTDTLFDGYKEQLNSFRLSNTPKNIVDDVVKRFQAHKVKLLNIMMDHDQFQAVKELAERYEEFKILVTLCQKLGNADQLRDYMRRYSDQGFSDFLFKQYLNEGHLNQLLSFSKEFPRELKIFLKSHSSLSWLHSIATQDYKNAQRTLKCLADQETKCVERKKIYLSLSKLTLLASEQNSDESALSNIDSMLQHIVVQEKLPTESVEAAGLDYDIMPPLSPERIIELYVGELNPSSTEKHFLLALEYLLFSCSMLDDSTFQSLAAYIWSRAILKNDWKQLSTDDVLTELNETFFFKLWHESIDQGWSTPQLLPDLEALLACPLLVTEGLHQNHTFLYFMKAAYELIMRRQNYKD